MEVLELLLRRPSCHNREPTLLVSRLTVPWILGTDAWRWNWGLGMDVGYGIHSDVYDEAHRSIS